LERANILLVEDDATIASLLVDRFEASRYRFWCAASAADAARLIGQARPDLVILDLMLPDANGLVLCAELKAELQVPIILCSATHRRDDPLLGFKLGADDFVAKPFSVAELQARVELALRRAGPASTPSTAIGNLTIDEARCCAMLSEQLLPLTRTEYRLLAELVNRPNEVLSHEQLTHAVWGYHDRGVSRSLEVHMRRLRAKLNAAGEPPPWLTTHRGFGYAIESDRQPEL
jgi:DNA-binding response OmpR family regulator